MEEGPLGRGELRQPKVPIQYKRWHRDCLDTLTSKAFTSREEARVIRAKGTRIQGDLGALLNDLSGRVEMLYQSHVHWEEGHCLCAGLEVLVHEVWESRGNSARHALQCQRHCVHLHNHDRHGGLTWHSLH